MQMHFDIATAGGPEGFVAIGDVIHHEFSSFATIFLILFNHFALAIGCFNVKYPWKGFKDFLILRGMEKGTNF